MERIFDFMADFGFTAVLFLIAGFLYSLLTYFHIPLYFSILLWIVFLGMVGMGLGMIRTIFKEYFIERKKR